MRDCELCLRPVRKTELGTPPPSDHLASDGSIPRKGPYRLRLFPSHVQAPPFWTSHRGERQKPADRHDVAANGGCLLERASFQQVNVKDVDGAAQTNRCEGNRCKNGP